MRYLIAAVMLLGCGGAGEMAGDGGPDAEWCAFCEEGQPVTFGGGRIEWIVTLNTGMQMRICHEEDGSARVLVPTVSTSEISSAVVTAFDNLSGSASLGRVILPDGQIICGLEWTQSPVSGSGQVCGNPVTVTDVFSVGGSDVCPSFN